MHNSVSRGIISWSPALSYSFVVWCLTPTKGTATKSLDLHIITLPPFLFKPFNPSPLTSASINDCFIHVLLNPIIPASMRPNSFF